MVEILLIMLICTVIFYFFVCVRHSNVDMIIIREQTEGEYTSLEHEVWLCFLFTARHHGTLRLCDRPVLFNNRLPYFDFHNNYSVTDHQENIEFCFPESPKFCSPWQLQLWEHWGNPGNKAIWFLCGTVTSVVFFSIAIQRLLVIDVINMICDGFRA